MATGSTSTQVRELDHKLNKLVMSLRLLRRKDLAERLGGINSSNFNHWIKNDGFVTNTYLQRLADLAQMSAAFFAASSREEYDLAIGAMEPDTTPWQVLLRRARRALIALRPLPALRVGDRIVVNESEWGTFVPPDQPLAVGDRLCVDLGVPWDYFPGVSGLQALLFASDELGSALVTPGRRPLRVERSQAVLTMPPAGPADPFVITPPAGPQSFTALFVMRSVDPAVLDGLAGAVAPASPYLAADALDTLARRLLDQSPTEWTVAHRAFRVEAA